MKLTLSAAMRARDVSRPRPEQVAAAEVAEASVPDADETGAQTAGNESGQGRPADDPPRQHQSRNVRRFRLQ